MNDEIKRIKSLSNQMCSMHAILRDSMAKKALALDLTLLFFSVWLITVTFLDPQGKTILNPTPFDSNIFFGCLSVVIFFLGIAELKLDFKGTKALHDQSQSFWFDLKKQCQSLLLQKEIDSNDFKRMMDLHSRANQLTTPIPESKFLTLKQDHLLKKEISKHLNDHPATCISLYRIKRFLRDNCKFF